MRGIEQKNGCIIYYGNPAGYIEKDAAVMDAMFQSDELERWLSRNHLTPKWTDGVYERLSSGSIPATSDEAVVMLKSCRIWQLKPGASWSTTDSSIQTTWRTSMTSSPSANLPAFRDTRCRSPTLWSFTTAAAVPSFFSTAHASDR